MERVPEKIIIVNDLDQFPPPFCYRYRIEIQLNKFVQVDFQVEYYDREELNEDEIIAEGFSENDDFVWKGKLPDLWKDSFLKITENLNEGVSRKNLKIELIIKDQKIQFYPGNFPKFEYFIQELIQAIYEASGRQEKFSFQLIHQSDHQSKKLEFEFSFYERSAKVNQKALDWSESEQIMKDLFSLEFDSFNSSSKKPDKEGFYVSPGDGLWYKADNALKSPDKKSVIPILEKIFKRYS